MECEYTRSSQENRHKINPFGSFTAKQKPSLPGYPLLKLHYLSCTAIENDKDWCLCEDEQHLRFYYNIITEKSQYANPYQYLPEQLLLDDYSLDDASFEVLWLKLDVLNIYSIQLLKIISEPLLCDILLQHHFLVIASSTQDDEIKIYVYARFWNDITYYFAELTFRLKSSNLLIVSKCQNPMYVQDFVELLPLDELSYSKKPICEIKE